MVTCHLFALVTGAVVDSSRGVTRLNRGCMRMHERHHMAVEAPIIGMLCWVSDVTPHCSGCYIPGALLAGSLSSCGLPLLSVVLNVKVSAAESCWGRARVDAKSVNAVKNRPAIEACEE